MKKYILIAGVNGAGKSTLYQSLASLQKMPRVNTDEIVKTFGNWNNPNDIIIVGIAKTRVKERVSKGRHEFPDKDIERRYIETFNNLKIIMPYCDKITFYDNSDKFHRFAVYENGKEKIIYPNIPTWFNKVIK